MPTTIYLVAILTLGYLSAHFLIGKLQTRFLFVSGVEYIVLGVLVGPHVTNLMTPEVVGQLSPVMSLAIGALGLLFGLELRFKDLGEFQFECFRVAFVESLTTFLLVAGSFALIFWYLMGAAYDPVAVFAGALTLGTTAIISESAVIGSVRRHYRAEGKVVGMLQKVVTLDQFLGILSFGFIFCLYHVGQTSGIRALTTTEWVAVNIVFGIVLGILFFLFLGKEHSESKLLLALMGIAVFSSGATYYMNLSPLFINLVLGIMLANTSQIRDRLLKILQSVEKPFFIVVLVFAGASWNFDSLPYARHVFIMLVVLYVLIRYVGKLTGGTLAFVTSEQPGMLSRRIGAGLLSQGEIAVVMVINYQQVYRNIFTDVVVTAVLVSVLLNEIMSPKLTKDLLVDSGDIVLRSTRDA